MILSHLSTKVVNAIVDRNSLQDLYFLLKFLVVWEGRPVCLTPMAYKWCSVIAEVAGFVPQPTLLNHYSFLLELVEHGFFVIGAGGEPFHTGEASHRTRESPQEVINSHHGILLLILEVGFRLVFPGRRQPAICLIHTPHHDLMFKSVFSSQDDGVIADGVCAWIADRDHMPAGSCVRYLAERVEQDTPFSPRLRQMSIRLIERMWNNKFWVPELEAIRLLNRLDVGIEDMEGKFEWAELLADGMRSPAGLGGLSIHYWHLLKRLPWTEPFFAKLFSCPTELTRLLEEAEDWKKLEVWMIIGWQYSLDGGLARSEHLEHLKQVTLKHLLWRPSALPRFEGLSESGGLAPDMCVALRSICAQARAEQLPLEPLLQ